MAEQAVLAEAMDILVGWYNTAPWLADGALLYLSLITLFYLSRMFVPSPKEGAPELLKSLFGEGHEGKNARWVVRMSAFVVTLVLLRAGFTFDWLVQSDLLPGVGAFLLAMGVYVLVIMWKGKDHKLFALIAAVIAWFLVYSGLSFNMGTYGSVVSLGSSAGIIFPLVLLVAFAVFAMKIMDRKGSGASAAAAAGDVVRSAGEVSKSSEKLGKDAGAAAAATAEVVKEEDKVLASAKKCLNLANSLTGTPSDAEIKSAKLAIEQTALVFRRFAQNLRSLAQRLRDAWDLQGRIISQEQAANTALRNLGARASQKHSVEIARILADLSEKGNTLKLQLDAIFSPIGKSDVDILQFAANIENTVRNVEAKIVAFESASVSTQQKVVKTWPVALKKSWWPFGLRRRAVEVVQPSFKTAQQISDEIKLLIMRCEVKKGDLSVLEESLKSVVRLISMYDSYIKQVFAEVVRIRKDIQDEIGKQNLVRGVSAAKNALIPVYRVLPQKVSGLGADLLNATLLKACDTPQKVQSWINSNLTVIKDSARDTLDALNAAKISTDDFVTNIRGQVSDNFMAVAVSAQSALDGASDQVSRLQSLIRSGETLLAANMGGAANTQDVLQWVARAEASGNALQDSTARDLQASLNALLRERVQ